MKKKGQKSKIDDVTITSIRWHSRAGQGAITAASALAEILGASGAYVQCFPEFGAEKRGAPVAVFNRISTAPITDISKPTSLDVIVIVDGTLIGSGEITPTEALAGLRVDGKLLVNTTQSSLAFAGDVANVYAIDGSGIAMAEIGKNIPNVPLLGALIAIGGFADVEPFAEKLRAYLAGSLPAAIVEGNIRAFRRGFEEVRKL